MTYEQFLAALRKTPRKWYLNSSNAIRLKAGSARDGTHCPITVFPVNGYHANRDDANTHALYLGLTEELADRLIRAADDTCDEGAEDTAVRIDLLRACGLAKQAKALVASCLKDLESEIEEVGAYLADAVNDRNRAATRVKDHTARLKELRASLAKVKKVK